MASFDPEAAILQLQTLGIDPAAAWFRSIKPGGGGANSRRKGFDLHGFDAAELAADNRGGLNLYVVIGAADQATGKWGVTDADITGMPALFAEWDDIPLQEQIEAPGRLGLPEPTLRVFSGGKSCHTYWRLTEPLEPARWVEITADLIPYCDSDPNCSNPSRLMRLAGGVAWGKKPPHAPVGQAAILSTSEAVYSFKELRGLIPSSSPERGAPPPPAPQGIDISGPGPAHGDQPRPLEEIRDALFAIPSILPNNKQRVEFRKLAWGLLDAVRHAGGTDADALALLQQHSPAVADAADYLKTDPREITENSFWGMARDQGWRPLNERSWIAAGTCADAPAPAPQRPRLSDQEKLAAMRQAAAALLEEGAAFGDRIPLLRGRAQELGITLRDQELQRLYWDARRAAAGTIEPLTPGDRIDLSPCPFHWEGVIMLAALNLLIALPKIGKTSLMLALIGAWHRGEPAFLGLQLIGPCPPVLIVGTDQPSSDWGRMLQQVGLLGSEGQIQAPIVALYHRGRPLHLDPEGIERIASHAAQHPGLFVLLDSIAALTGSLGIDENSAEIAEPIADLMEAVEPHGATLLAIHHASKGRAGESATLASRGSTALPAAASQIISLARLSAGTPGSPQDRRIVMKTEGRGGLPQHLLIERTEEGWISHGSAESVALAQHLLALEEKLTDRQAEALELVRNRWASGERTDAKALAVAVGSGRDCERTARRTLDGLARKGLLRSSMETERAGRRKWFWPVGAEESADLRTPSRGGISEAPYVSDVSEGVPLSHGGIERSDTSDSKDTKNNPPREGVRTSAPAPAQYFHDLPPVNVLGRLLWFRQQFPGEHANTLAGRLDPFGDLGINGRKVRSWLDQIAERDPWDLPDPIPPAEEAA